MGWRRISKYCQQDVERGWKMSKVFVDGVAIYTVWGSSPRPIASGRSAAEAEQRALEATGAAECPTVPPDSI